MIHDNPARWNQGFQGSEHPETARLRVEKDFIDAMIALKRENMDRVYAYLNSLLDKAKDELQHARGVNNDHRRAALRQHIDEILAYLKAQSLEIESPPVYGENVSASFRGHYILEEVATFFGTVKCVLDQWYDSHLIAVYDEMVTLVNLKPQPKPGRG